MRKDRKGIGKVVNEKDVQMTTFSSLISVCLLKFVLAILFNNIRNCYSTKSRLYAAKMSYQFGLRY